MQSKSELLLGVIAITLLAVALAQPGGMQQGGMQQGGMQGQGPPRNGTRNATGNMTVPPCCEEGQTDVPTGCVQGAPPSCRIPRNQTIVDDKPPDGMGSTKPSCCKEGETDDPEGCVTGSPPDCLPPQAMGGNAGGEGEGNLKDRIKDELLGGGEVQCPKNDEGVECGGSAAGMCVFKNETKDGSVYRVGRCECNQGFFKPVCASEAELQEKNEERGAVVDATQKKAKREEERKSKCTDEAMPILCPSDDIFGALKDTCQDSMLSCFGGNQTLSDIWASRKTSQCAEGETFCDVDGCVQQGTVCSPVSQDCPNNKKYRCPDWSCAANVNQCPVYNASLCPDAEKPVLCPDAVTCAEDRKECAKIVTWEGCDPGTVECAGMQGVCVEAVADCVAEGGCPDGEVFCGVQLNADGTVMWNDETDKPVPNCVTECKKNPNRKPEITSGEVAAEKGKKIEAKAADGVVAAALKVFIDNAFRRADNGSGAVNFTFSPVPDSLISNGAFSDFLESGALLTTLIQLEPSAELVIVGGFLLEIPIEGAGDNETLCNLIIIENNLQMLKVPDITNISANTELAGKCSRGPSANCTCGVNITHFSTYGVVASSVVVQADEAAAEDDDESVALDTTTPTPESSPVYSSARRIEWGAAEAAMLGMLSLVVSAAAW